MGGCGGSREAARPLNGPPRGRPPRQRARSVKGAPRPRKAGPTIGGQSCPVGKADSYSGGQAPGRGRQPPRAAPRACAGAGRRAAAAPAGAPKQGARRREWRMGGFGRALAGARRSDCTHERGCRTGGAQAERERGVAAGRAQTQGDAGAKRGGTRRRRNGSSRAAAWPRRRACLQGGGGSAPLGRGRGGFKFGRRSQN